MKFIFAALLLAVANFLFNYGLVAHTEIEIYSKYSLLVATIYLLYSLFVDWIRLDMLKKCVLEHSYLSDFAAAILLNIVFLSMLILIVLFLFNIINFYTGVALFFTLVAFSLYELVAAAYRVKEEYNHFSNLQFVRAFLVLLALAFVYFADDLTLNLAIIMFLIPFFVSALFMFTFNEAFEIRLKSFSIERYSKVFKDSIPLISISIISTYFFYVDRYVSALFFDESFLAFHTFTSEIVRQVVIFPLVLINARFFSHQVIQKAKTGRKINYFSFKDVQVKLIIVSFIFSFLIVMLFPFVVHNFAALEVPEGYIDFYIDNQFKYYIYYALVGLVLFYFNPKFQIYCSSFAVHAYGLCLVGLSFTGALGLNFMFENEKLFQMTLILSVVLSFLITTRLFIYVKK